MRCLLLTLLLASCAGHRLSGPGLESPVEPVDSESAGLEMATLLVDLHRADEALALLHGLSKTGVHGPRLDLVRARALASRGQLAESELILRELIATKPRDPQVLGELGLVLFDSGARVEAEAFFRRALELDRRDPRLLNNLGFLLLVDGRPADAVVHLEQAARLDPTDRRAFNNLGFAYGALGDDRRALESFRAAVDEAGALANLGLACERRGDAAAAAGWYGKALALSPRHPLAFEGMERLGARPPIEEKNP